MKISSILLFLLPSSALTLTCEIKCEYFSEFRYGIGLTPICSAIHSTRITEDFTTLKVLNENSTEKNFGVQYFAADEKEMFFMPQDMHFVFGKLLGIEIINSKLMHLRHKDLKNYPHLTNLNLKNNQLRTVTSDVFKANLNLKFISLRNNKLLKISPSAFEILPRIEHIWLEGNCGLYNGDDPSKIKMLIKKIRNTCSTDDENPNICGAKAAIENERMKREIMEKDFKIHLLEDSIRILEHENKRR